MVSFYDSLDDEETRQWILSQHLFWVATAPLSDKGHVNVSPKGRPTFNLVGETSFWYADMSGSGNETISHLYEKGNGRITIMFMALEGEALIIRLYGQGKVYERGSTEFDNLLPEGDQRLLPGTRCIIWVDFHKVALSCGWTIPFFSYEGERLEADKFFTKMQDSDSSSSSPIDEQTGLAKKLIANWNKDNSFSIDGLPGLKLGSRDLSKARMPPFDTYAITTKKEGGRKSRRALVGVKRIYPSMRMVSLLVLTYVIGLLSRPLLQTVAGRIGLVK